MEGLRYFWIVAIAWVSAACQPERSGDYEIEVSETRPLTSADVPRKLHASAGERFFDLKPFPFTAQVPDYWFPVAPGKFAEGAYRIFGGKLTVSVASGGIGMNINRWMGQFGQASLNEADLKALPRIPMAGHEAVLIETTGTFQGRTGPPQSGQALFGAIAPIGEQLLVIKFVGPEEALRKERSNILSFANSLSFRIEEPRS